MHHELLKPRQALNIAFLKVKTLKTQIPVFKGKLIRLFDQINESDFLVNELYRLTEEEIKIVKGGEE